MTKLAAIDIGSNAIRLYIKDIDSVKKPYCPGNESPDDYFNRVAIRLGDDVYTSGFISIEKEKLLISSLKQFRILMESHHVEEYRACATASFRDAKNGVEVATHIFEQTGIKVEIISGSEEVSLARRGFYAQYGAQHGDFLFCDVGGGSTDICLCHNEKEIQSHSFAVGSMRMVNHSQKAEDLQQLTDILSQWKTLFQNPIHVIGSGGSIHKICQLFTDSTVSDCVTVNNLCKLRDELAPLSTEQKMERYHLKRDRAEIIVEAADIFIRIAQATDCSVIHAPVIGVRDGIIASFLQERGLL